MDHFVIAFINQCMERAVFHCHGCIRSYRIGVTSTLIRIAAVCLIEYLTFSFDSAISSLGSQISEGLNVRKLRISVATT